MQKLPKGYKFFSKPIPATVEEEKLKKLRSKLKEIKSEQFWKLWRLVCIPDSLESIETRRNEIVKMKQEIAECVSHSKQLKEKF